MKQIKVESGQSLIDVAMQEHGTPQALVTICDDNGLEYDADLISGQALLIREVDVDELIYHNSVVFQQLQASAATINTHTDRELYTDTGDTLPSFYGAGSDALDELGIKGLSVIYKSTRLASLPYVANMQRLWYVHPLDEGDITKAIDPGGYDFYPSFDVFHVVLTIDGTPITYEALRLKQNTYLVQDDNYILNFR